MDYTEIPKEIVCLSHDEFCEQLTAIINTPYVKTVARRFATRWAEAEDLISETYIKALENREKFEAGSNMKAWFTFIMTNQAKSKMRKYGKREFEMGEGQAERVPTNSNAHHIVELKEALKALYYISPAMREAFDLVVLQEMTYEEASIKLNCPLGTIKSKVGRARLELHQYFGLQSGESLA